MQGEKFGGEQKKYWVFFTDKNGVSFNPFEYFDPKTIENRLFQNIPLIDSSDFPLNENYVSIVKGEVDSASYCSRWFNGMAVIATGNQIEKIKSFQFVKNIEPMESESALCSNNKKSGKFFPSPLLLPPPETFDTALSEKNRLLMKNQTKRMGGEDFEKMNLDGKGIRIAVFDAGFPTVDFSPTFEHLRKDKRILKTWDFVKNKEFVYGFNEHGTMVLSCIAGKTGNEKTGLATGSEFILARTEMAQREPFSEEENWLAAVEWADKNGANIISSSLAYTYHRYFRKNMDGKTSLVSKAATMAASKGILVVNAAGNDGNNEWKIIATPSDADSVLSVGGISPGSDYHINFSSFGPTSDKRMKPNVCAYGQVIVSGKKGLEESFGTSFATPLVAGFAACAWQKKRSFTNMELFREIEKSGHLYPYFDYAHGFGIPQAGYFINENNNPADSTFEIVNEKYVLKVLISDEFFGDNNVDGALDSLHTKNNSEINSELDNRGAVPKTDYGSDYLYYHIENSEGTLDKYFVIRVDKKEVLELNKDDFPAGKKLMVFYKGYSETFTF